jgi:phosphoglycolate phosphatase-like HAD superfamily hydrolase
MRAAGAASVTAIGVGWGFSGADDLARAGAALVLDRPDDLATTLLALLAR